MKKQLKKFAFKIVLLLILVLVVITAYLRFWGVTHEQIVEVVNDRSDQIINCVEVHAAALDRKLDRIDAQLGRLDSKLDRLLKIAEQPLPDGLQPAR